MSDNTKPLPEDDGTDPLTLTNLILNKNAHKHGFDHVHQQAARPTSAEEMFAEAPKDAFVIPGEYEKDPPVKVQEDVVNDANVEANNLNPNIVSSDPKFNPCPAYIEGLCRIDGRPCPYSAIDYKECGKYYLATSGDPELFDISPGREDSPEYQSGIKA